ncbi:MAG: HTH domain-containing protein [Candidatus Thermoplasmatota archaeon]|nr:HTH domain-containing protein [Candidatus Thermoplasmatota archaeon]
MTIRITKQMKILELRNKSLSIRKIAKELHISKTTVVKYLKLFSQGYNPNQVNIYLPKKKTPPSLTRQNQEKILLPEYNIEDEPEYQNLEHTIRSLNQQIIKLEEDNLHLNKENNRLQEQLVSKDEEIENKTELIQEQKNQQISKPEEDNIYLKKELYRYQEQLVSKDEEIENKTQLIQKLNDDIKIMSLLGKLDGNIQYNDQITHELDQINTIYDKRMDKNEIQNMISKEIQARFNQNPQSIAIDTIVQKESDAKKPNLIQNLEKVQKPDLNFKKSSDNEYSLGVDVLQIGVLSFISLFNGIQNGLNNDNQIILYK